MEKKIIVAIINKDYEKAKSLLTQLAKTYKVDLPKHPVKENKLKQYFIEFIENGNGYKTTIKNLHKEL